jgi:hypothetical protein
LSTLSLLLRSAALRFSSPNAKERVNPGDPRGVDGSALRNIYPIGNNSVWAAHQN